MLESATAGSCKTFIAGTESLAAHQRYLYGAWGGYLKWVRNLPDDFWRMGEGDGWLEHGTEAKSKRHYYLRMTALLSLQPLLFLLFAVAPDAKGWLDSPGWVITERAVTRREEHRFWVPLVARPHQIRLTWIADPIVVLSMAFVSDIVITAACTFRPPAIPGGEFDAMTVLAMLSVSGAVVTELEQAFRGSEKDLMVDIAQHFSDPFNIADAVGLGLASLSLVAHAHILMSADGAAMSHQLLPAKGGRNDAPLPPTYDAALGESEIVITWLVELADSMSVAVLVLWLRPLRMLYLSPTLGPYLYMLILMLKEDVFKIISIALSLAFAFAGSQLNAQHTMTARGHLSSDISCERVSTDESGKWEELRTRLFGQVDAFLGKGENPLDCLHSHGYYTAWGIHAINVVVSLVLLLNMLIASMSTTFNNNDETRDVNYAFCNAQLVQSARDMPILPAPFNLIGLPSRLLVAAVQRFQWSALRVRFEAVTGRFQWFQTVSVRFHALDDEPIVRRGSEALQAGRVRECIHVDRDCGAVCCTVAIDSVSKARDALSLTELLLNCASTRYCIDSIQVIGRCQRLL